MSRISDNSAGRGEAVTLPFLSALKSKPKLAFLVQSVPEGSQVPERDRQIEKFEMFINRKWYGEVAELGKKMSDGKLLKCLCQMVTTVEHFKGLYESLKRRNLVPDFLAKGKW